MMNSTVPSGRRSAWGQISLRRTLDRASAATGSYCGTIDGTIVGARSGRNRPCIDRVRAYCFAGACRDPHRADRCIRRRQAFLASHPDWPVAERRCATDQGSASGGEWHFTVGERPRVRISQGSRRRIAGDPVAELLPQGEREEKGQTETWPHGTSSLRNGPKVQPVRKAEGI